MRKDSCESGKNECNREKNAGRVLVKLQDHNPLANTLISGINLTTVFICGSSNCMNAKSGSAAFENR